MKTNEELFRAAHIAARQATSRLDNIAEEMLKVYPEQSLTRDSLVTQRSVREWNELLRFISEAHCAVQELTNRSTGVKPPKEG